MALTLDELAALAGGEIVRPGAGGTISGVASLDEAGPEDASFFGNEGYRRQFSGTRAGVVLVTRGETGGPDSTALVAVDDPTVAIQSLVERLLAADGPGFVPGIHPRAVLAADVTVDPSQVAIGPGAVVGSGSVIGSGTSVGANVVIGESVTIGRDCVIHPSVTIRERSRLGDRVILHSGVVIGADGYGYRQVGGRHVKIPQVGIVEIGDDVEIGANSTVDRARFGRTVIGEGTKIDNLVQIAHNVVIGRHCLVVAQSGIAGSSRLGDGVVVAAQAGVAGHVSVGDGAVLTARTGVTASIGGGRPYAGMPARPLMEEQRERVRVRQLPRIAEELRELKKRLDG